MVPTERLATPNGEVTHGRRGRARLQVPGRTGDPQQFRTLRGYLRRAGNSKIWFLAASEGALREDPSILPHRSFRRGVDHILEPLVPQAKPGGRPRAHHTREELLDAIFFYIVVRGGGLPLEAIASRVSTLAERAYHYTSAGVAR